MTHFVAEVTFKEKKRGGNSPIFYKLENYEKIMTASRHPWYSFFTTVQLHLAEPEL